MQKKTLMVGLLVVLSLVGVSQAAVNLQITEIYAGTSPKLPGVAGQPFDTSEWFEITNFGDTAADLVASPVYYDDESADPTKNTQLLGVSSIAPGESVVFFVDWESDLEDPTEAEKLASAYALFETAWGTLPGVQIGYCSSAGGLGSTGDTMYIFDGNVAGSNVLDSAGYTGPATSTFVSLADGTWNGADGVVGGNDLAGVNGLPGWAANVSFGDPAITLLGSPGVVPEPATMSLIGLGALALIRRRK